DDTYLRRCDHGRRSQEQRVEPLSAELGRIQPVRHGCYRLPAERRLQSHGYRRRARLLGRRRDRKPVLKESWFARAGLTASDRRGIGMRVRCLVTLALVAWMTGAITAGQRKTARRLNRSSAAGTSPWRVIASAATLRQAANRLPAALRWRRRSERCSART